AVLGFQAASGLFTTDDIMTQGPLYARVDEAVADWFSSWHHTNEWIIVGLVALHLAAVLWYAAVRRKRLVRPMITGDVRPQDLPAGTVPAHDGPRVWLRALLVAGAAAALVWWIRSLEIVADFSFS